MRQTFATFVLWTIFASLTSAAVLDKRATPKKLPKRATENDLRYQPALGKTQATVSACPDIVLVATDML
jgi:hypothetical protein